MMANGWGSDVPVSMPQPVPDGERLVPMFGFVFTSTGIAHDLSHADWERLRVPTFAPIDFGDVVRGDQGL